MEHLTPPLPPPTEVVTDLEFIFLGGTKLVHTLREADSFEDRGDHYYISWADTGEDALLFKSQILQFGRRVRLVQKADQTAVQKVVADIKKKEAAAQMAAGKTSQNLPSPAAVPLPGVGTSVPSDLWDRSPLKR